MTGWKINMTRKGKIIATLAGVYLLLVIGLYVHDFLSHKYIEAQEIDVSQMSSDKPVGEIVHGKTIGQTFLSRQDNLDGISIMFATFARKNNPDIIFHLKESPEAKQDIFTKTFNASELKDNSFFDIKFPPLKNSKGKRYYFEIESPQAKPGDAVTIWASDKPVYSEGELFENGVKSPGALAFKTYYLGRERVRIP